MAANTITNPTGAFGLTPQPYAEYVEARNSSTAISRGDVVFLTYSTTTGEVTCSKAATGTSLNLVYGVADENISANKVGRICVRGFCYVNVGGNTVAAGDGAQRSGTTAGIAVNVTVDATTIVGQTMGTFIGAKGSASPYPFTNAAPVWLGKF